MFKTIVIAALSILFALNVQAKRTFETTPPVQSLYGVEGDLKIAQSFFNFKDGGYGIRVQVSYKGHTENLKFFLKDAKLNPKDDQLFLIDECGQSVAVAYHKKWWVDKWKAHDGVKIEVNSNKDGNLKVSTQVTVDAAKLCK